MSDTIAWSSLRKDAMTTLEGDFPAAFTEVTVTNAASSGKPMLKCTLKVTEGQYAGRKVYHNFTISAESGQAMQIFFRQMDSLGLDEDFFANEPGLRDIADALLGKECTIAIKPREWQGRMLEDIKAFKPYGASEGGGSLPTALPGDDLPATPAAQPSMLPPADPF